MRGGLLFALLLTALLGGGAAAQSALSDAAKAMLGTWEFSNADREKICAVTFRADPSAGGMRVEFERKCAGIFPFISEIVSWSMSEQDFLRLLDAKGQSVLEFSEVEGGIFEAPRPGEGILFIQNASTVGPAPRTAEQMTGDWTVMRGGGKTVCTLTLSDTASGEEFAVRVQRPCDAFVTRFAPVTWQMDRGEVVLKSARGQSWRFEEGDGSSWRRVPQSADPVLLVRK
jgi:hypothetical protein